MATNDEPEKAVEEMSLVELFAESKRLRNVSGRLKQRMEELAEKIEIMRDSNISEDGMHNRLM